jgi:hypothetical protein
MPALGQVGLRLRKEAGDDAVFDDDDGPFNHLIGGEKASGSEYRAHTSD